MPPISAHPAATAAQFAGQGGRAADRLARSDLNIADSNHRVRPHKQRPAETRATAGAVRSCSALGQCGGNRNILHGHI